jgi:GWxTD domain-containing protein
MSFYSMKRGLLCLIILLPLCFFLYRNKSILYSKQQTDSEDWIDGPVKHIITIEEEKQYKKLRTKEEKEQFIKWFWDRRDYNPETISNEFQDEFNRRVKYADFHLSEIGLEGWRTARGRVYIILGPPSQEKLGKISLEIKSAIVWYYESSYYLNSGYVLIFLDQMGDGHYCLSGIVPRNHSGEDYYTIIQKASFSELSSDEWASFFGKVNEKAIVRPDLKLEDALPKILLNDIIELEQIPFKWNIKLVPFTKEEIQVRILISLPYKEINFYQKGDQYYVNMSISVTLYKKGNTPAIKLNDNIVTQFTAEELIVNSDKNLEYKATILVSPGEYDMEITLTDSNTGMSRRIIDKLIVLNRF